MLAAVEELWRAHGHMLETLWWEGCPAPIAVPARQLDPAGDVTLLVTVPESARRPAAPQALAALGQES